MMLEVQGLHEFYAYTYIRDMLKVSYLVRAAKSYI